MFIINFDPVFLSLGPLTIYWYGVSYVVSLLLGAWYVQYLVKQHQLPIAPEHIDRFVGWMIVGVIVGGRLGHILFYDLTYYCHNPLQIFMTWKGGMSFHGGLVGAVAVAFLFCKQYKIHPWVFGDLLAAATPIGLGFGRVANFINQELYGTVTSLPWGCVFLRVDNFSRHPSQLYEAFLEGFMLFFILFVLWVKKIPLKKPGICIGVFLFLYGIFRFCVEFVREPEGFFFFLTTGQALSLPMMGAGMVVLIVSIKANHFENRLPCSKA